MPLGLPTLRRLIDQVIRTDAELNALFTDYFPSAHLQVSDGMERAAKVSLLFRHATPDEILAALRDSHPDKVVRRFEESDPPELRSTEEPPLLPSVTDLPASLIQALKQRRVVPFAGAGISMAVKGHPANDSGPGQSLFPSWRELLERAAQRLIEENAEGDALAVQGALRKRQPDFLLAARIAKEGLGPKWYSFLRATLNPPADRCAPETLESARLMWQFGSKLIITTNYDRVLRWACPPELRDDLHEIRIQAEAEQVALLSDGITAPTIWYLHGSIDDVVNIILTPDGYSRLYPDGQRESVYKAALLTLHTLLATRTLLFVGFSFTDKSFGDQLAWITESFAGAAGPHYLLVRDAESELARERLKHLPLELIPYADHGPPLLTLLRQLASRT